MGRIERLGVNRADDVTQILEALEAKIDRYKLTANHQAKAIETVGAIVVNLDEARRSLASRVEELEAELRYRLLPWWIRGLLQVKRALRRLRATLEPAAPDGAIDTPEGPPVPVEVRPGGFGPH